TNAQWHTPGERPTFGAIALTLPSCAGFCSLCHPLDPNEYGYRYGYETRCCPTLAFPGFRSSVKPPHRFDRPQCVARTRDDRAFLANCPKTPYKAEPGHRAPTTLPERQRH